MKLTIDNLDGHGAIDYSSALGASKPITIERKMNQPTICSFSLVLSGTALARPSSNGRMIVTDSHNVVLFTGYVAAEPTLELAGAGTVNAVSLLMLSATSDEVLLDKQAVPQTRATAGGTVGHLVATLTGRVDSTRLSLQASLATTPIGHFLPNPGESWSQNTAALALMARSAYYAHAGAVNFAPVGSVSHSLSEAAGTLQVSGLQASMVEMLANDVTLCGEEEAGPYVTEIFQGDGTTAVFDLTGNPYFPSASHSKPLVDLFQGPAIDAVLWQVTDGGSHLSLTAAGLTCNGGDGVDGETAIVAIDQLEMGGALILECGGVTLGATSAGILCGLYQGPVQLANCFAGFEVQQVSGATVIAAVIQGVAAGSSFAPTAGHSYTFRIRSYSKEAQRVLAAYYAVGDGGAVSFGGTSIASDLALVLEIQDTTSGGSFASSVLYDGMAANAPAVASFAPINSTNLIVSIASVAVAEAGAVWITSQSPGGTAVTQRLGSATQSANARLERTGRLRFYPGSVPVTNATITVTYRLSHRAVARMADAASIAREATGIIPGTARWVGTVTSPAARSSADCENAALAFLAFSTSRAAAWSGRYAAYNLQATQDIWPGDVLTVAAASLGMNASLVVRAVTIEAGNSAPDLVKYTLDFANDWADALAIKLSSSVPDDAWLPQQASSEVSVLASLSGLAVASVSASAINIAAGAAPPSGGGFEVRRRDWHFAPGNDSDLVLRSPVANFSIPRESAIEQYYIRQYDASTPPRYGRFSSAVFINVAL